MSANNPCTCGFKVKEDKETYWKVTQRNCNHSAFSGYRETPSAFSAVICVNCHGAWRTKAAYVLDLGTYYG